jgi:hypothetical protein
MLLLLALHPGWDATLGRSHTRSNARKNLGARAEPPVRIHIIKKDFDFNLLSFIFIDNTTSL